VVVDAADGDLAFERAASPVAAATAAA